MSSLAEIGVLYVPTIDMGAFTAAITLYIYNYLERVGEDFIKVMSDELDRSGVTPRDGSKRIQQWKDALKKDLKIVSRIVKNGRVELTVGIDNKDTKSEPYRKAYIIAYGGGPTFAGPKGRIVWDENYSKQTKSRVKEQQALPPTWIMAGNDWVNNAEVRFLSTYLPDELDTMLRDMPDSIWQKCITYREVHL